MPIPTCTSLELAVLRLQPAGAVAGTVTAPLRAPVPASPDATTRTYPGATAAHEIRRIGPGIPSGHTLAREHAAVQ